MVVHPVHSHTGSKASRLLLRLDSILGREQRFGLVFDLGAADPGAGMLVETALAERASRMAERCVGAVTVIAPESGATGPTCSTRSCSRSHPYRSRRSTRLLPGSRTASVDPVART